MPDLTTSYLGLSLKNPFIVGASPLCDSLPTALRLQKAGAAAVVMRSLFAEQLEDRHKPFSAAAPETPYEDVTYHTSPRPYLSRLKSLASSLEIPVIASLNGYQPGSWTEFARELEDAGAAAIELNFYRVVADVSVQPDETELEMLRVVGAVSRAVKIPVAAKIGPYHTAVAQLALALQAAGAAGIILFNRFYQPDISVETMEVTPVLHLSDPGELLLRLRWLSILSPQLRISLAATGGIRSWQGAVKALLCGAHAVQIVSELLHAGPGGLEPIIAGTAAWMHRRNFGSLEEFQGQLNFRACSDPGLFERANYIRTLGSWN